MLKRALALLLTALAVPVSAQEPNPQANVDWTWDSGFVSNTGSDAAVVASELVDVPGALWMRVFFDDVLLAGDALKGNGSIVRISSLRDASVQKLNAVQLQQWNRSTAYFNGDTVLVEIIAEPRAGANRITIDHVEIGVPSGSFSSVCGATDDRMPSTDPRVARTFPLGCTAFMIDDCKSCFLSAGHCGNFPVVQFNVPLSNASGSAIHPPATDQYSVDGSSRQRINIGVGRDWQYFGVFANSNTGLTPVQAQGPGYAFVAPPTFNSALAMRVTGHGIDSTPPEWNRAQQTHAGPWTCSTATRLCYQADTEGANSGSPIILDSADTCVGIHTAAGCGATSGSNSGTSFNNDDLQYALAHPRGVCAFGLELEGTAPITVGISQATSVVVRIPNAVQSSVEVHVRYDGGAFTTSVMTPLGNSEYRAFLQAQSCSELAEYYFTAQSMDCGASTLPAGAPAEFFRSIVGDTTPVFIDSFQSDMGWTVSDDVNITTGTWQRGDPINDHEGDPENDFDGSGRCWVTANVLDEDVDGGASTLTSPPFDTTGGALISWAFWLNSNGFDQIASEDDFIVEYSIDAAGSNWFLLRSYTESRLAWQTDFARPGVDMPASGTTRLRFTIADNPAGDVLEAAVDAFRVETLSCTESLIEFCHGDGGDQAGCTDCPCGNDAAPGTAGGCVNSAGQSARLFAAGSPSLANDTLRLEMTGSNLNTFGVLVSGANQLPSNPTAPCPPGAGVISFLLDGLRCVGGDLIRQGARATDANGDIGATTNGWGPPSGPAGGLAQDGGFTSGQTRFFQVFYREADAEGCATGQNTSNGVQVTFLP